jgi:hypothetical protein
LEGQPEGTTDEQIVQSDWLRGHENPKDAATQRDLRVRARAIATRIIAPVDEEDRLPEAMQQEEAADRAELARLCGTLAAMDVPIETSEQGELAQSHRHAIDTIMGLPDNENVEELIVNGKRIPVDPIAAGAQYGETLGPGRAVDDKYDASPNLEEEL